MHDMWYQNIKLGTNWISAPLLALWQESQVCYIMKIVEVTWHDITSESRWMSPDTIAKIAPVEVIQVGWLIKRTKKFIYLGWGKGDHDEFLHGIVIPMGVVKKVRRLK